jgi:hypothetical protein
MSDPDHTKTYVRETRMRENNGVGMAVIVGGLVVAVGFVLWFLFGALVPDSTTPVDGDTNVTIEPAPAPDATAPDATTDPVVPADPVPVDPVPADPAPAEPAPDAAPVEPAPVDPAVPAPADE